MGLSDLWKGTSDQRAEQVRRGAVAPSRSERQRCWESRDSFFACLDRHGIVDALEHDRAAATQSCGAQHAALEKDCASEWVAYFKRWRVAEHQKRQRLAKLHAQGAQNMQIQADPAGR